MNTGNRREFSRRLLGAVMAAPLVGIPQAAAPALASPQCSAIAAAMAGGSQQDFDAAIGPLLAAAPRTDDEALLLITIAAHAVRQRMFHRIWICEQALLRLAEFHNA
jgi:hypothetical protein